MGVILHGVGLIAFKLATKVSVCVRNALRFYLEFDFTFELDHHQVQRSLYTAWSVEVRNFGLLRIALHRNTNRKWCCTISGIKVKVCWIFCGQRAANASKALILQPAKL